MISTVPLVLPSGACGTSAFVRLLMESLTNRPTTSTTAASTMHTAGLPAYSS